MKHSRKMTLLHFCFIGGLLIFQCRGQALDKKIMDAAQDVSSFDLVASENSQVLRVELDILMKMDDYVRMQRNRMDEKKGRTKRKAYLPTTYRWTNKQMPYTFAPNTFSTRDTDIIMQAINQWNNYTCLNMRPATQSDTNQIQFQTSSGCSSYIGMIGGTQPVNLASGCRYVDIVVHELGHAAGFYHEQSRRDRDDFIEIVEENVPSYLLYNFEKAAEGDITNLGVPYDYRSVMHYSGTAFGIGGATTIRTKDPSFQNIIGNAPGLSFADIRLANLMYNCNEACQTQLTCPGEGFQGGDCRCYCPKDDPNQPIKLCDNTNEVTTQRPATTTTDRIEPTCQDNLRICPFVRNFCGTIPGFMNVFCPRTCNRCTVGPNSDTMSCVDYGQHCEFMKGQGNCENAVFSDYMKSNCAKTCEFCKPRAAGNEARNTSSKLHGSILLFLSLLLLNV